MASSSSTTCSPTTSAADRATFIAGSGRPRVLGPTELYALMTRACPCRLDRSPLISSTIHRFLCPNGGRSPTFITNRRSEPQHPHAIPFERTPGTKHQQALPPTDEENDYPSTRTHASSV